MIQKYPPNTEGFRKVRDAFVEKHPEASNDVTAYVFKQIRK